MERRKAVTAAATVSLTLLAGATGVALDAGILGTGGRAGTADALPVDATTPSTITVFVDDPAPSTTAPTAPPTPAVRPSVEAPTTRSSASSVGGAASGREGEGHDDAREIGAGDDD